MRSSRRARRNLDIWPGYVDALATLLMVIIFVLLIFVLAQFFLSNALTGSEGVNAALSRKLNALAEQFTLEKTAEDRAKAELENKTLEAKILSETISADVVRTTDLQTQVTDLNKKITDVTNDAEKSKQDAASAEVAFSQEIDDLKQAMARVAAALDESQKVRDDQKLKIDDLGQKLNLALADKVQEMKQYRSEFFGRLRKVLGDRPGIRIEGDRFILQSELLFATGSADLGPEGVRQVDALAATIKQIQTEIPKDIPWVLRVDGHTDKRPISGGKFPSNWELSTERAINVVRELMAQGITPDHLAAAGFGEFQPLDAADNEAAYSKNRRIELRLDQR